MRRSASGDPNPRSAGSRVVRWAGDANPGAFAHVRTFDVTSAALAVAALATALHAARVSPVADATIGAGVSPPRSGQRQRPPAGARCLPLRARSPSFSPSPPPTPTLARVLRAGAGAGTGAGVGAGAGAEVEAGAGAGAGVGAGASGIVSAAPPQPSFAAVRRYGGRGSHLQRAAAADANASFGAPLGEPEGGGGGMAGADSQMGAGGAADAGSQRSSGRLVEWLSRSAARSAGLLLQGSGMQLGATDGGARNHLERTAYAQQLLHQTHALAGGERRTTRGRTLVAADTAGAVHGVGAGVRAAAGAVDAAATRAAAGGAQSGDSSEGLWAFATTSPPAAAAPTAEGAPGRAEGPLPPPAAFRQPQQRPKRVALSPRASNAALPGVDASAHAAPAGGTRSKSQGGGSARSAAAAVKVRRDEGGEGGAPLPPKPKRSRVQQRARMEVGPSEIDGAALASAALSLPALVDADTAAASEVDVASAGDAGGDDGGDDAMGGIGSVAGSLMSLGDDSAGGARVATVAAAAAAAATFSAAEELSQADTQGSAAMELAEDGGVDAPQPAASPAAAASPLRAELGAGAAHHDEAAARTLTADAATQAQAATFVDGATSPLPPPLAAPPKATASVGVGAAVLTASVGVSFAAATTSVGVVTAAPPAKRDAGTSTAAAPAPALRSSGTARTPVLTRECGTATTPPQQRQQPPRQEPLQQPLRQEPPQQPLRQPQGGAFAAAAVAAGGAPSAAAPARGSTRQQSASSAHPLRRVTSVVAAESHAFHPLTPEGLLPPTPGLGRSAPPQPQPRAAAGATGPLYALTQAGRAAAAALDAAARSSAAPPPPPQPLLVLTSTAVDAAELGLARVQLMARGSGGAGAGLPAPALQLPAPPAQQRLVPAPQQPAPPPAPQQQGMARGGAIAGAVRWHGQSLSALQGDDSEAEAAQGAPAEASERENRGDDGAAGGAERDCILSGQWEPEGHEGSEGREADDAMSGDGGGEGGSRGPDEGGADADVLKDGGRKAREAADSGEGEDSLDGGAEGDNNGEGAGGEHDAVHIDAEEDEHLDVDGSGGGGGGGGDGCDEDSGGDAVGSDAQLDAVQQTAQQQQMPPPAAASHPPPPHRDAAGGARITPAPALPRGFGVGFAPLGVLDTVTDDGCGSQDSRAFAPAIAARQRVASVLARRGPITLEVFPFGLSAGAGCAAPPRFVPLPQRFVERAFAAATAAGRARPFRSLDAAAFDAYGGAVPLPVFVDDAVDVPGQQRKRPALWTYEAALASAPMGSGRAFEVALEEARTSGGAVRRK